LDYFTRLLEDQIDLPDDLPDETCPPDTEDIDSIVNNNAAHIIKELAPTAVDNFLVLANNQNNTDGDIQVVQDPADRLAAQKDIFNEGPIVETVAHYQSHVSTSSEDPDNLKDLEAKISLIKETSPKSITSDLTPDHAHLPQSQTSYAPPTRCVTVSESNTQAQPGKIQRTSVIPREAPYTVPTKFQCDQCDFSSPSPHGLKIHTGKAHKLHTVALPLPCTTSVVYDLIPVNTSNDEVISYVLQPQPSSTLPSQNAPAAPTLAKSANAIRCDRHRKNNKIKKQNAVEKLKSLEEKNIKLKAKEDQLRIMVEQRRML